MNRLVLLGIPIALAACAEPPELASADLLAPAANAQSQIRPAHGQNLMSGYRARAVKGPDDWRKLNDRQSPTAQEDN